jgi:hypothetical protein
MRWLLPAAALLSLPAAAAERVGVRTGDHPGHGRIVFDWPEAPPYTVERQGDRVLLRFPEAMRVDLGTLRRLPRNIVSATAVEGGIALELRPGSGLRHFRNGARVALDAIDPPNGTAPAEAQASPIRVRPPTEPPRRAAETSSPLAARQAPSLALGPATSERPTSPALAMLNSVPPASQEAGEPPASVAAPPQPKVPSPALNGPQPEADRAAATPLPPARELRLRLEPDAAAAALRRGDRLLLVFDTGRPEALEPRRLPTGFEGATLRRVPGAAALLLPLASGIPARLTRDGNDWILRLGAEPSGEGLTARPTGGAAEIAAREPRRIVSLPDPLTGLPLLVGTVAAAEQRQEATRRPATFELPETLLGAAVLARSDRVGLRGGAGRFLVSVQGAGALGQEAPAGLATAAALSRTLDIPAAPVPDLAERLRSQQASIAALPPLQRAMPRLSAAETLLALGLPQEAQAMLRIAAQEVPEALDDPRHNFAMAAAALLGGRLDEARGLMAPATTDEALLWQGLYDAAEGRARRAAPSLTAGLPLLLAYPEGLRRRLLPLAAEALAEGGEPVAARRAITAAGAGAELAAALLAEAEGEAERALEAYDAVAQGRDRRARAQAMRRGAELRLAIGRHDAAAAARALEAAIPAWRGEEQELSLRLRAAELRRDAGEARAALALLQETLALFPERAAALRVPLQEAFLAALANEAPVAAVALHDANPELLPSGERGEAALAQLADRLAALDLADRAAALLRRAMERASPGEERAGLGLRLARQRLGERDAEGALAALAASAAPALPSSLVAQRGVAAAQAEAQRGRLAVAVEALTALGPAGDEALADILIETRDHAGAAAALGRVIAARGEALDEAGQRLLLRRAALLALAGDEPGLARLRQAYRARTSTGPAAAALDALTADPARGLADLPRLQRELNLFRTMPVFREPLRTAQGPAG